MKLKFVLLLLLVSFCGFAQLSTTHYIPPITTSNNTFSIAEEQFLYISTPSTTPVNFTINQLGGTTIVGSVSRDIPFSLNVGYGPNTQFIVNESNVGSIVSNKGYIIEADNLIYATVRLVGGTSFQAGQITSKGLAGLGKSYSIGGFLNKTLGAFNDNVITFASVLATENNTVVRFSNIKPGVRLLNNAANGNADFEITLNIGESYVIAAQGSLSANRDGLIGAKIIANKDVVVNCGSTTGSNASTNTDYGIDQIVSTEKKGTGKEYIFIKNSNKFEVEVPLLIATVDTKVFLNDNVTTTPDYTILAGNYLALNGTNFNHINKNLYVRTDNDVFAYQSVGEDGREDFANQNMFFVPPLSCETPKKIDNIPQINKIGNKDFSGRITITTKAGSVLSFIVNSTNYTLAGLSTLGCTVEGPNSVIGKPDFVTYSIIGLTGNVSAFSTSQLYLAAFGSSGAAMFGGYYSGFALKPEIIFGTTSASQEGCIPNVVLSVSSATSYDQFDWFYEGTLVGNNNVLIPNQNQPGYYSVTASISACGAVSSSSSDVIPISNCPTNNDTDLCIDNLDIDFDNDGIPNCTESFGNLNFNFTLPQPTSVNFGIGNYSNSYSKTELTNPTSSSPATFYSGFQDVFNLGVAAGRGNTKGIEFNFANPISLQLEYPSVANAFTTSTSNSEFVIICEKNKNITVLNPSNQLLIDTDFNGVYESGVTNYSSFEIRFRLNSSANIQPQNANFSFRSNLISKFQFIQKNLSSTANVFSSFKLFATCIPKDSDGDSVYDQFDSDSDNDGILDNIEISSQNYSAPITTDLNNNGMYDVYDNLSSVSDTDLDNTPDYLDLDSDNDTVYDLIESGSNGIDANNNGILDGTLGVFGQNGLLNSLETVPESGVLNYTLLNYDADTLFNFVDGDSDGDACNDQIEAGISAINFIPKTNYSLSAPITIVQQPSTVPSCLSQSTTLSIETNSVTSYQWEISTNSGATWSAITNNSLYSGSSTANLQISATANSMSLYQYRVQLTKTGNTCGKTSNSVLLQILPNPIITSPISLLQCDDDTDGISIFNLNQKNSFISSNYTTESFSFYKTESGAISKTTSANDLISNNTNYVSGNGVVFVRVENSNGCFSVGRINLIVSVTQINLNAIKKTFEACDNIIAPNTDGISEFDFSEMTTIISNNLPASSSLYNIIYFANQADALAEQNPITNIGNYQNTISNEQNIWVRIDSTVDNSCFGLGVIATLIVNQLPKIELETIKIICLNKPTEKILLTVGITDGTSENLYTYIWKKDQQTLPFLTSTIEVDTKGIYTVEVSRDGCSSLRTIKVIASDIAYPSAPLILDFSSNNTITIVIPKNTTSDTLDSFYNFEYSLDLPNGPYQSAPFFENVSYGFHKIYINDRNECGIVSQDVWVLGGPSFFTPNADGYNDSWNITGFNPIENASSIVYIYDRYGKLIKQISVLGEGWDGTLNGTNLPADDYWFMMQLQNGRNAKGHFTLKR